MHERVDTLVLQEHTLTHTALFGACDSVLYNDVMHVACLLVDSL